MSTDSGMTVVTALIRPHMEGHVVRALHELPDFPGFTLTEVRGQGRGRGAGGTYQATEFGLTYQRHLQLQLICPADKAVDICRMIAAAAWTGRKGDGVVFTTGARLFWRIREEGARAKGPI
jgi:nitrogen regulatory protein PII